MRRFPPTHLRWTAFERELVAGVAVILMVVGCLLMAPGWAVGKLGALLEDQVR